MAHNDLLLGNLQAASCSCNPQVTQSPLVVTARRGLRRFLPLRATIQGQGNQKPLPPCPRINPRQCYPETDLTTMRIRRRQTPIFTPQVRASYTGFHQPTSHEHLNIPSTYRALFEIPRCRYVGFARRHHTIPANAQCPMPVRIIVGIYEPPSAGSKSLTTTCHHPALRASSTNFDGTMPQYPAHFG
jgi:hypothetical protein